MFVFLICLCDLVFYFNDLQLKAIFSKKKLGWPWKGPLGLVLKRTVGISSVVGVANHNRDHVSTQPRARQAPPPSPSGFRNTCRKDNRGFFVWIWYAGRDIYSSLGDSSIGGTLRRDDCFLPDRCLERIAGSFFPPHWNIRSVPLSPIPHCLGQPRWYRPFPGVLSPPAGSVGRHRYAGTPNRPGWGILFGGIAIDPHEEGPRTEDRDELLWRRVYEK